MINNKKIFILGSTFLLFLANLNNPVIANELPEISKIWNFSKPSKTETDFRRLLEISQKKDKAYSLEIMTQIARTQGLQMKFEAAHKTLNEVEKLLTNELVKPRIRYNLERGRVYNSSKKKDKSLAFFKEALKIAVENKEDYLAIDAAHMLGIADKLEEQIKWNEKAIEIAENSKSDKAKGWLGSLYNNTGWTYHDQDNYEKALELFKKNLKWNIEKKKVNGSLIAKWSVARALRSLKRTNEALEMQYKIIEERKQKGLKNSDGYVYEEIGECLLEKNQKKESKEYFAKAYEILSKDKWLQKYEKDRLKRMKELSK